MQVSFWLQLFPVFLLGLLSAAHSSQLLPGFITTKRKLTRHYWYDQVEMLSS